MMYHVQWEIEEGEWLTDNKYHSLDEALRSACAEAMLDGVSRTRVIKAVSRPRVVKTEGSGKVKVLAKFKPLRDE
jgi:hypothetical protein